MQRYNDSHEVCGIYKQHKQVLLAGEESADLTAIQSCFPEADENEVTIKPSVKIGRMAGAGRSLLSVPLRMSVCVWQEVPSSGTKWSAVTVMVT